MVVSKKLSLQTRGNGDTQDITAAVAQAVIDSGVRSGVVTLFCPGSTAPSDRYYRHNERWGDGNGHSHVRAALLGPSLAVPFVDRMLTLGTWQQIVHVDFDVRPRRRDVIVQIVGE